MLLQDAVNDYLLHIKHEQGLSRLTCTHYGSHLRHFQRWLAENGYPEAALSDFSPPLLRRYLYHLSGRGLRPRAIRSHFYPIRGLSAFLVSNKALTENPAVSISMPKKDAAQRLTVSDEEVAKLMDACERQRNPRRVAFSRAILSVLAYAALRRQECLDLRVADVDIDEGAILVRSGKGGKSRKLFTCDACTDALREWIALRPKGCRHDYLFALDTNRRIGYEGLAELLESIKAIAGLAGAANIKPHSLRHACATRMLRNGADLKSIQVFLGHSSLAVTSVYLHSDEQQLRSVAELTAIPRSSQQAVPAKGAVSRFNVVRRT